MAVRAPTVIAIVAVASAAAGFALWYPNRTVRTDSDYWGDPLIRMRWGKPVELIVDRDRNGFPEVRALYSGYDELSPHAAPDEVWEDWNSDGFFERHYLYSGTPRELSLEVDTTGDHQYDLELRGDAAEESIKEHPWPVV